MAETRIPVELPTTPRRLARVRVSFIFMELFLKAGTSGDPVRTDAPQDFKILQVRYPVLSYGWSNPDSFELLIESDEFEPVPDGEQVPEVEFKYWREEAQPTPNTEEGC